MTEKQLRKFIKNCASFVLLLITILSFVKGCRTGMLVVAASGCASIYATLDKKDDEKKEDDKNGSESDDSGADC